MEYYSTNALKPRGAGDFSVEKGEDIQILIIQQKTLIMIVEFSLIDRSNPLM